MKDGSQTVMSSSFAIECIRPEQLQYVWPALRKWAEEASKHACGTWIAEDIYTGIKTGRATLYVAKHGIKLVGFFAAELLHACDGAVFHIWAAYSSSRGLLPFASGLLNDIAHHHGARRVTFSSPRIGWERYAKRFGFQPTMTIFTKEVAL